MTMNAKPIRDTDIRTVKKRLSHACFIDDDIIMCDTVNSIPLPEEPKRMTFILVALCTGGTARYTVDTQEHTVKKGDVVVISERNVVDMCSTSDDMSYLGMILSVDFFYEVISNVSDVSSLILFSRDNPVFSLDGRETDIFKSYFYMMKEKMSDSHNHFRRNVVRALMLAMFYDLNNVIYRVQESCARRQTRADSIFTSFIMLVEENYRRERRVGWYAEQLCITPKYLSETVKTVSKHTPNEWIDNYVTLEIRVLLKNTSKSIKEIATDMNFPNQSFLGKYFKEHVGVSPSRYRRD